MEDEPVSNIRETSRKELKLTRRFHRGEEADFRRSFASSSIKTESIEEIANKLKTKSSVSLAELQTLKNGLMEDSKNLQVVLNINGALRGLVRELTGTEVRKQCSAAGCFCNLALGDCKSARAVAKSAGPYLVADVGSLSTELAVTCIWAVGNLAGSGPRAGSLLIAQGALPKLCDTLNSGNEELVDAALYALVHFAYQMKDDLSTEHLTKILEAASKTPFKVASSQLLFILSCHQDFVTLPDSYLHKILQETRIGIQNHFINCINSCAKDCQVIYLVRTLANVCMNEVFHSLLVDSLKSLINELRMMILKEDSLAESMLWLLGNMFKFSKENVFFNELLKPL